MCENDTTDSSYDGFKELFLRSGPSEGLLDGISVMEPDDSCNKVLIYMGLLFV